MLADQTLPRFLPVGDMGMCVEFGTDIDPVTNAKVVALDRAISSSELPGIIETVPSYRSLLIVYEPAELAWAALQSRLLDFLQAGLPLQPGASRRWTVPVAYDPPFGEDVAEVAGLLGLSAERVIEEHAGAEFRVYMLGFLPAMPYLGGLPETLRMSRRLHLRAPMPARSVAIAGVQSAIMPFATTTGWYLLGRTPVRPFDERRSAAALFQPGDLIRFRPIGRADYQALERAAEEGDLLAGAELIAG